MSCLRELIIVFLCQSIAFSEISRNEDADDHAQQSVFAGMTSRDEGAIKSEMGSEMPRNAEFQKIHMVQLDAQVVNKLVERADSYEESHRLLEAKLFHQNERLERAEKEAMIFKEKLRLMEQSLANSCKCNALPDVTVDIAFSAYIVTNPKKIPDMTTIIFDRILVNDGNGYDSSTGLFTVPISGAYQFSYHIETMYKWGVAAQLKVNDGVVMDVGNGYSTPGEKSVSSVTGTSLIVNVYKGDKVRVLYEGTDALFYNYSIFSGFLLYVR